MTPHESTAVTLRRALGALSPAGLVAGALLAAPLLGGCGPSFEGQGVMTPQERLEYELKLAEEDEKKKKERGDLGGPVDGDDEVKHFDKKHTKMELQRATRSAESCPGVVKDQETPETAHRGELTVTITFQQDGSVKDLQVPAPFDDSPVGECVARAYRAVIVPPYDVGGDQMVDWTLNLEDAEEEKGGKGKK